MDRLADLGRAGECDLVDAGMLDDHLTDRRSRPRDHIDHAWGNSDLLRDLGERQRRERRLARRLDDHGVAAREGGRHLPRRQEQRKIPRHDGGDDADRLAQGVGEVVALDRNRFAVDLVGPSRVILKALRRRGQFDLARFEDRLAVVERLEPRNLVRLLHELVADLPHQAAAFARRQLAPGPVERRPRGGDGGVHVALLGGGDRGDDLFGRRIDDLERLARRRVAPFAVDEELLAHHACG